MDDYGNDCWFTKDDEVVAETQESQEPEREVEAPVLSARGQVTLAYVIGLMEKKRALAAYAG
jgi:hypothetical protein